MMPQSRVFEEAVGKVKTSPIIVVRVVGPHDPLGAAIVMPCAPWIVAEVLDGPLFCQELGKKPRNSDRLEI